MAQKIVFENAEGGIAVAHPNLNQIVGEGDDARNITLAEVVAISVPFKVSKDGWIVKGVAQPVQVTAGTYVDARLAELNELSGDQVPYKFVDENDIPADRLFRQAWRQGETGIVEDTEIAKEVAHELRRAKREEEFAPLDKAVTIAAANPEKLAEVEAEREEVREKYHAIQDDINACDCADTLREKLAEHALI